MSEIDKPTEKVGPQNRTEAGRFQKGKSGNPGGRPKDDLGLRDLARAHTVEALETLVEIMRDKEAPPQARAAAACSVLDRGHGKPVQMTELTGKDGGPIETKDLSEIELAQGVAFILNAGVRMKQKDADQVH